MGDVHSDFDATFELPQRYRDDDGRILTTRVETIGRLDVDGVAAGDPLGGELAAVPEHRPRRAGCDVRVVLLRADTSEEMVAVTRLELAPAKVSRWERSRLAPSIASGTAAFAAPADPGLGKLVPVESLRDELNRKARQGWSTTRVAAGRGAVVAFTSGMGEGVYDLYWGLDDAGAPAALALDFELLVEPVWEQFVVAGPIPRGLVAHAGLARRGVSLHRRLAEPRWLDVRGPRLAELTLAARLRRAGGRALEPLRLGDAAGPQRLLVDLDAIPADAELVIKVATRAAPLRPYR